MYQFGRPSTVCCLIVLFKTVDIPISGRPCGRVVTLLIVCWLHRGSEHVIQLLTSEIQKKHTLWHGRTNVVCRRRGRHTGHPDDESRWVDCFITGRSIDTSWVISSLVPGNDVGMSASNPKPYNEEEGSRKIASFQPSVLCGCFASVSLPPAGTRSCSMGTSVLELVPHGEPTLGTILRVPHCQISFAPPELLLQAGYMAARGSQKQPSNMIIGWLSRLPCTGYLSMFAHGIVLELYRYVELYCTKIAYL